MDRIYFALLLVKLFLTYILIGGGILFFTYIIINRHEMGERINTCSELHPSYGDEKMYLRCVLSYEKEGSQ